MIPSVLPFTFADQVKAFCTWFGMWQENVRTAVHELHTNERMAFEYPSQTRPELAEGFVQGDRKTLKLDVMVEASKVFCCIVES